MGDYKIMDIDDVLTKMSTEVEKSKSYLKGIFNKETVELKEAFQDALSEERIIELALVKIGKRYGMDKSSVAGLYTDLEEVDDIIIEETIDELDEVINEDDLVTTIDDMECAILSESSLSKDWTDEEEIEDVKEDIGRQAWRSFMKTVVEPVKPTGEYERTPSLIIEIGATYTLKVDTTEPPYEHEFDGTYGLYTKWAFKVTLVKVSDEELYGTHYKKGEFEGQPAYVNGNRYTLWLDEKAKNHFGMFWKKLTTDGLPDNRVFTFKHSKKGKYNDFKFGLPKR